MMSDLLILGTDTDAGKTTLALLWLSAFADRYEYWKPVESGDSDTEKVRRLVPAACVHPPLARFIEPVAPLLAARKQGTSVPSAAAIVAAKPTTSQNRQLLIESFGSPFSPLTETELQIDVIQRLNLPCVLVSSSVVGAIGRTLQTLEALAVRGIAPVSVVLVGLRDRFAEEQVQRYWPRGEVFSIEYPTTWDADGIRKAASEQLASRGPRFGREHEINTPAKAGAMRLEERDRQAIWHPYTSLREPDSPVPVVGAQDEFLYLADGRKIIDGISSWWTILHGHRHPVLVGALQEALGKIDHVHFAGVTHAYAVELAELMLATCPWKGGRVFYSDNGSTAVEIALKMAYQYWCHKNEPQRKLFVGFENGYHGDTFGAMAVGRDPVFFGRFEPLLFRAEIVSVDAERLGAILERHSGEVAAVIIEPLVQGAGGMRMHSPEQLRAIFEVTRKHGVLFIADEVMTGGGRTSTLWAHEAAGIAPDLICAAKTLTGGMLPLAATLASPTIVDGFDAKDSSRTFFHGHSFTAHPLACAVAAANWRLLTAIVNRKAERLEPFWSKALTPLRNHPNVADVRIRGAIAAVELRAPGGYLAPVGRKLRHACLERGVLLRPLGSVLYAMPPLCTSDASLAQIADAMIAAVSAV